jgi:hypothetical protein
MSTEEEKERRRQYVAKYRREHKDKIAANRQAKTEENANYMAKWREKNKEKAQEQTAKAVKEHRDRAHAAKVY